MTVVSVLIIYANIYLIKILWPKRRITVNVLFIMLSCFDILSGVLTVSLFLLSVTLQISYCSIYRASEFSFQFYSHYQWLMVTLITIDRYLMITQNPRMHAKYMTVKRIFCYIFMFTVWSCSLAIWGTYSEMRLTWLKESIASVTSIVAIILEFTIICGLYIHLVVFVHNKNKIMQGSRHDKKQCNYSMQTAKTVFLVLVCLVCCKLPYVTVIQFFQTHQNTNLKMNRNLLGWFALLSYSN